ncbi:hypothetical protein MRX96_039103 [Rhipicephalus microplus]
MRGQRPPDLSPAPDLPSQAPSLGPPPAIIGVLRPPGVQPPPAIPRPALPPGPLTDVMEGPRVPAWSTSSCHGGAEDCRVLLKYRDHHAHHLHLAHLLLSWGGPKTTGTEITTSSTSTWPTSSGHWTSKMAGYALEAEPTER